MRPLPRVPNAAARGPRGLVLFGQGESSNYRKCLIL